MRPIRIIVAGLGYRGLWGLKEILRHQDFEVAGLLDSDAGRMRLYQDEFALSAVPCFTNLPEALRVAAWDALAVFTPDGQHAELIVPALEAGKWVFAEKPLEVTAEKVRAIVNADCKAGERPSLASTSAMRLLM